MNLLYFLLLITAVFIILVCVVPAKVTFAFDSRDFKINLRVSWLSYLFKADVVQDNAPPVLIGRIINVPVYKKVLIAGDHRLHAGEASKMKLMKNVHLRDVDVQASYGFSDPATTGIACGILGILSQLVYIDSLYQNPDFMADEEYVYILATAKVNIGLTMSNLIRAYITRSTKQLSYESG